MTRITVDSELLNKLGGLTEQIELWDEQGKLLAIVDPVEQKIDWESLEYLTPPISDEERRRRINSGEPTYTTEEVLAKLREL